MIKSLLNNVYYYQDKLGSTTHVANASGQLLESYKYDLYGTPSYLNETTRPSQPINSSTVGVADLYSGERWLPELGLYDLRNRFMSPELGRFLQPDPIGFKGDASNLYRYCHNDPEDFSDPMGLVATGSSLEDRIRLFHGDGVGSLSELDSQGGTRYLSRSELEGEMSRSKPLSAEAQKNLDRGCIGLVSEYQGQRQDYPGHARGTKAYLDRDKALRRDIGNGKRNFVFAKQGRWTNGDPHPDRMGRVPADSISNDRNHFNYIVYFPKTKSYAWMNNGVGRGLPPQEATISNRMPEDPDYPHTVWYSTPRP